MIKAVLDTNIIISGLISPSGAPGTIMQLFREKRFCLIFSREILEEITQVLTRPKIVRYGVTPEKQKGLIRLIYRYGQIMPGEMKLSVFSDPDDDKLISCAMEGKADYLVTGDLRLLEKSPFEGVEIITANRFVKIIENIPES